MKKYFFISLISTLLALQGLANDSPEQTKNQTEIVQTQTPKFIDELMSEYRQGKYKAFLEKSNKEYLEDYKKFAHNSALDQRKKLSAMISDFQQQQKGIAPDKFAKQNQMLQEARDRELIEICLAYPNATISREVKDMVFYTPSKEDQESFDYLTGLSLKFKGDGKTPLENKLIQIDTEFWLKSLTLDIALAQNHIDKETFKKRNIVLHLEKLKKMKEACQDPLNDPKITKYIETVCDIYPKVKAVALTRQYLFALGKGKVAPKGDAEKEMQKVMMQYLDKEDQLIKEHLSNG